MRISRSHPDLARRSTLAVLLAAVATVQPAAADWGPAVNLGAPINSPGDELGLALSADGLVLVFDSDRPGGHGDRDLYRSDWTDGVWSEPTNLGPSVNTPLREYAPDLSPSGVLMYTTHGFNLRTASPDGGGSWIADAPLGTPIDSGADEWGGRASGADTIVFSAFDRAGGAGGHDVWTATRVGGVWQAPVALTFNTSAHAYMPFVAAGGDSMFLCVDGDVAVAYAIGGGEFGDPVPVPGGVGHPGYLDASPVLSPDGLTLYFTSDRPGGLGGYDVWVSQWVAGTVSVPDAARPERITLSVMPNPFRPRATVLVHTGAEGPMRVTIVDVAGRRVRSLFDGPVEGGLAHMSWDGLDEHGRDAPPGTYFTVVDVGDRRRVERLVRLPR